MNERAAIHVVPANAGIQRLSSRDSPSPRSGGQHAPDARGWLRAHKWLLLRRASQFGILALFLLGPAAGIWIVRGNLASSMTLGFLPLTEPFVLAQALAAGALPYTTMLAGAAIVVAFYALFGGRAYCAWVCPLNIVTDAAAWLRPRLGIRSARAPSPATRYWLLAGTLVASAVTGTLAWELVNPVSLTQRAIIFGGWFAWSAAFAVFVFDLLVARHGFCGHVCPQGALYALLGRASPLHVAAARRRDCDDCADCYAVCPEPAVIPPALKPRDARATPLITAGACTRCGRCIDVCRRNVFEFTLRIHRRSEA